MSWIRRLANAVRRREIDSEIDEEMRFHLEARRAEYSATGRDPQEAARRFGSPLRHREASAEAHLLPWLDSLVQDTRFAFRVLRRTPAFTVTAIVTLALALGANAGAFALLDALIFRPLPVYEPDRLVYLTYPFQDNKGQVREGDSFQYPVFRRMRESARGTAQLFLASYGGERRVEIDPGRQEKILAQWVSGDVFSLLGVNPALGRLFTADDDKTPGKHPVAVISYDYWTRRFARDPGVLGRWVRGEKDYQIIGVVRPGFHGIEPGVEVEMWVPSMMWNARAFENLGWSWFRILGRLQPDATRDQLRGRLQGVFTDTNRERMKLFGASLPAAVVAQALSLPLQVNPAPNGASRLRATFARPLWILGGVAAGLLLIACAVLANLLLARSVARSRELALRASIGAGRGRLLQQLLVEAGLLSLGATALGCVVAVRSASWIAAMMGRSQEPVFLPVTLDVRVVAAMGVLSVFATLLFGLLPAWRAAGRPPHDALKSGGARHTSRSPMSRMLVCAQVAFCCLLLFTAGLFLRSFDRLTRVDLGFRADGLVLLELEAPGLDKQPARGVPVWEQLRRQAAALPGIQHASLSGFGLFTQNMWSTSIRLPDGQASADSACFLGVAPGFVSTMGMHLLAGRDLLATELALPGKVALVNRLFVQRYLDGAQPLGRRVEYGSGNGLFDSFEIVGVVDDARYGSVRDPAPPTVYMPFEGGTWGTLLLRTNTDRFALARNVQSLSGNIYTGFRVIENFSQQQLVNDTIRRERLLAVLSSFFSSVALLLAAIGLYGVLSYLVAQRNKEIGIRLALGCPRPLVIGLVVRDAALVTLAGIAIGLTAGIYLTRYVTVLLFEVKAADPASLAWPAAALLAASLLAALRPVWRATHVDTVLTLRDE